jgi:alkanesulfonate monooxygenase SsuD/methylene tetrahydromethanopterin reductase-like flavin-dependent oxidoreductase (luciferase family)
MRFSVISGPRQRADLGQSAAEAWRDHVNDAVLCEELGFDSYFIGEHHFCFASGNSAPLMMLAEMAARTTRMRIGTSIICAPFHNPLTLAENIAAVDIISNGRFDLGIGVGSQWEEFQTFGIDPKERFGRTWECLDIIERCLHGDEEEFDHVGKYFNFPGVRWIMKPIQERIPIFWGGFAPQGVARAAERGYHLIAPDVTGTYQRITRAAGRRPEDYHIGFINSLSIADTWEDAYAAIAEPAMWLANVYGLRPDLDGVVPPESNRVGMAQVRHSAETRTPIPPVVNPIVGTVGQIMDHCMAIVRGERGLITHFAVEARIPGMATEDVHRTLTRFAQEIMPEMKAEAAKRGV